MGFEDNPADEDPHGECRHEIHQLQAEVSRLKAELRHEQYRTNEQIRDKSRILEEYRVHTAELQAEVQRLKGEAAAELARGKSWKQLYDEAVTNDMDDVQGQIALLKSEVERLRGQVQLADKLNCQIESQLADLQRRLDYLKSIGLTVTTMKDQKGERLVYVIADGSELDDKPTLDKLFDEELKVADLQRQLREATAALAWIRTKLKLPDDAQMFSGDRTIAGALHVWDSHQHGYMAYIAAYKCNNKQGEIGRLSARLAAADKFKEWVHAFLDGKGVPADPDPEGNAEHGCRISGRMKWIFDRLAAAEQERDQWRKELDNISAELANEGPHTLEHLMVVASLGKHTTVIGRSRLDELHATEGELTALRQASVKLRGLLEECKPFIRLSVNHGFVGTCELQPKLTATLAEQEKPDCSSQTS